MAEPISTQLRRPFAAAAVGLAVIGWLLVLWLATARAGLEEELGARDATLGDIAALEDRRAALQDEVTSLEAQRLSAEDTAATATERQAALVAERDALQQDLDARRTEFETLEAELGPMREELAGFDARLADVEESLSARTAELTDVGARLETARAREAELRDSLTALNEEASTLASQAAEAEGRAQSAREAEAAAAAALAEAEAALASATTGRDALAAEIETLTGRRDAIRDDVAAAEEQRQSLQALLTQLSADLAARSERLATIEARIADLQGQEQEQRPPPAAGGGAAAEPAGDGDDALLAPGRYSLGPVEAEFAADGTFRMANPEAGRSATGRWQLEDGALVLAEVAGDLPRDSYRCALAAGDGGHRLEDADGGCGGLTGQVMAPARD